jgi:hypothetical protein
MRTLIVKDRKVSSVKIRTGESAPEKYAGAEMAKYLGKFGIPSGEDLLIDIRCDAAVPRDGYVVRPEEDGTLSIRGGGGRGAIYGVYGFLEHYAGTRFFMPGLEKLGEGDITVDEEYVFTPVFEQRRSDWQCGARDADWCVKNGVNNPAYAKLPEEMGGAFEYVDNMFCHTMQRLTGVPQSAQPCLSDPETLKKVISGVREILAQHPDAAIISVTQNDNVNSCKCPKCTATDEEEGSPSGTLLRFINAVADDVAKDYPNVVIDTFAYTYTRKAPRITRPRPNVCIRLCSIECCFSHPLSDTTCPMNAPFFRDLLEWNKICDRIYVWDYVTNFCHYIPPFPNFRTMRENMRFFAEHGVRGMYPEGNYSSVQSGEFGELRCYLLAKLMMNPYMSAGEYYGLMDEFLEAYYGAGWRYIRAFIDWSCSAVSNSHMGCYPRPFQMIPRKKYLAVEDAIESWWEKAEEMAGDRVEAVRRSRIQWRYIRLMLHPDPAGARQLKETIEKEQIQWREGCRNYDDIHYDLQHSFPEREFPNSPFPADE